MEGHPHVSVGAEQDRLLALDDRQGGGEDLVHDDGEGVAHAGVEQGLALGDQGIELGEEVGRHRLPQGKGLGAHSSFLSSSTASTSCPTVSISACMFMVMRISNSDRKSTRLNSSH